MKSLTQYQRHVILQYRFVDGLSFPEISNKMKGVTTDAARQFVYRTRQRAGSDNIADLLANSGDKPGRGRPARVPPDSIASGRLRQYTRGQGKYQSQVEAVNQAYKRVRTCQLNLRSGARKPLGDLAPQQVHNITQGKAHSAKDSIDSRPISRLRAVEKVPLHRLDLEAREKFCRWIQALDKDNTILIGCDETPLEFGGSGHTHISAPKGTTVYTDKRSDPRFKKMQWAASSNELRVTRPCLDWTVEEEEDAKTLSQSLARQVAILKETVDKKRANCTVPGTTEYDDFNAKQASIDEHNAARDRSVRGGYKQKMTPARMFKYEKLERDHGKGGIDFVWYAFKVYEEQLIPYYNQVKALNPHKHIYIIEDNVGLHHKARRLIDDQIQHFQIEFRTAPTNSPDLYPYEQLHKVQKNILDDYRQSITSAAASVQIEAAAEMRRVWQRDPDFARETRHRMAITYWQGIANRAEGAVPKWSNRFKDTI